jgi:hypothetical protein
MHVDGEELLEPDDDEVFMVARPGDTYSVLSNVIGALTSSLQCV